MKTSTVILILGAGALGLGAYALLKEKPKAAAPVITNTTTREPSSADRGIYGSGISTSDLIALYEIF